MKTYRLLWIHRIQAQYRLFFSGLVCFLTNGWRNKFEKRLSNEAEVFLMEVLDCATFAVMGKHNLWIVFFKSSTNHKFMGAAEDKTEILKQYLPPQYLSRES